MFSGIGDQILCFLVTVSAIFLGSRPAHHIVRTVLDLERILPTVLRCAEPAICRSSVARRNVLLIRILRKLLPVPTVRLKLDRTLCPRRMRLSVIRDIACRAKHLEISHAHLALPDRKVNGKGAHIFSHSGNRYLRCLCSIKALFALLVGIRHNVVPIQHGIFRIAIQRVSANSKRLPAILRPGYMLINRGVERYRLPILRCPGNVCQYLRIAVVGTLFQTLNFQRSAGIRLLNIDLAAGRVGAGTVRIPFMCGNLYLPRRHLKVLVTVIAKCVESSLSRANCILAGILPHINQKAARIFILSV